NEAWSLMRKYTFEFGGGFKDYGSGDKLTLFAGYTRLTQTNPGGVGREYHERRICHPPRHKRFHHREGSGFLLGRGKVCSAVQLELHGSLLPRRSEFIRSGQRRMHRWRCERLPVRG